MNKPGGDMINGPDTEPGISGASGHDREALSEIARMLEEDSPLHPPADLPRRTMVRLRASEPSFPRRLARLLLERHTMSFDPVRALHSPVSRIECSFYYVMAGAFYTLFSAVLLIGFQLAGPGSSGSEGVGWQMQIALGSGLVLAAIGGLLLKNGKEALFIARVGSLFFLGFIVLSGFFFLERPIPFSPLSSVVSLLVGIPIGLFLVRMTQNCGGRYA